MAAKRHHAAKHHSHMRTAHHSSHHSVPQGYYEGAHERNMQERQDAGMISEDHHAVANLPQHVIMRAYPMEHDYMPEGGLDDTLRGIDMQMDADNSKRKGIMAPKKW